MAAPPQYTEVPPSMDEKIHDQSRIVPMPSMPWVVQRTSVTVESTPLYDDHRSGSDVVSISSSTNSNEKRGVRSMLSRIGPRQARGSIDCGSMSDQPFDSIAYGTEVTIEGGNPKLQRLEMKGLEQAASMKRWTGNGKSAEAWGKLVKDPELWDPAGDTLVFFGYQRPQASFRVNSSTLEHTKSDILLHMLQQGLQRQPSTPKPRPSTTSLRGFKGFGSRKASNPSANTTFEQPARYKLHFPAPEDASRIEILRHHITTRNFLALLMNKPIVGLTLYQALVDLLERLQLYMPSTTRCAQVVVNYLIRNRLHNVSNDPAAAAGLLAWCEDFEVRWEEGWREAFVHSCGMYKSLKDLPELRDISPSTRALLERASLDLRVRVQEAEDRLCSFRFDELIPTSHSTEAARASFNTFRQFLKSFYEKAHGAWPPKNPNGTTQSSWLSRYLIIDLQRDFGALYDFLADHRITWDSVTEPGSAHRCVIDTASKDLIAKSSSDFSLTKILVQYDRAHRHLNIPHPYPLLPTTTNTTHPMDPSPTKQSRTPPFLSKPESSSTRPPQAYLDASNATLLGQKQTITSALTDAFLRFERTDQPFETHMRDARLGRWMLLYGILQVLSTVAVDTPGLFFADVPYFLGPRLRGMPPWKAGKRFEEAEQEGSWCWVGTGLGKDGDGKGV